MDIRTQQMEGQLFEALERTDAEMERRYGDRFELHPARLPHGKAATRQYDGLFSLSAGFSAGFGSQFGPGYALDLRLVTLESVPESFRAQFEAEAVDFLQRELDQSMPERRLKIVRDVNGWKIVGDLSIGTAGAATSTPAPSGTTSTTGDNMNRTYKAKIAVQLYSIHQYTQAVGLKKTIEDVAKIGYAGIEFAGYWNCSSAELKQMLDDNGLVACGTHVNTDQFKGDALKAACEFNLGFGNNLLICPGGGNGIPKDWDKPADDWWKYLADFYAKVADEAAKFGCRVGLHNHAWEFQTKLSDGTLMWDYFFSNTPKSVCMEQDVGWTTYAGYDPCEQYLKYPGRSLTLHAKENGLHEDGYDAILGKPAPGAKGVEWEKLFPVAEKDGVEWYVVECERHFDSLEAITPSYAFLKPYFQA